MSPDSAPTLCDRGPPATRPGWLARLGEALRRNQRRIRAAQWAVVAVYLVLVAAPALLPLPPRTAHVWNNLTVFAQFAFWGVWWPFVLLSMVVVGRAWCGFFCPEGALTEFVSGYGRGRAVPRWLMWRGWPFVAFACTTVYGQLVSVYQYPKPVLLILGGSTLGAIAVGWWYGRNKRVWCRYLCPVNGVFALLSKLAPFHYRVDGERWAESQAHQPHPAERINCAPLVPIRTMESAGPCHMCGRCAGFRDAVTLSARIPGREIVAVAGRQTNPWESVLILVGMLGIAVGAFHWSASPWFLALKDVVATALIDHDVVGPVEWTLPWWLLTDYPAQSDVMTVLDGAVLLAYVAATAAVMTLGLGALVGLATRLLGPWSWPRFHHLVQALIPVAGCGIFLGLSMQTVSLLRGEGVVIPGLGALRLALLAGALLWSAGLAWRVSGRYGQRLRRIAATAAMTGAAALGVASWALLFWGW
ncbi:MAG: 4Fe-4S binding protein [Azospirillaceae bacterium]|nr:4Fe-4S binding protein [Azospirillaceae bacterium]